MKLKKLLTILLCIIALLCTACSEEANFEGQTKVVFCLEGGTYQNSTRDVVHYYKMQNDTQTVIAMPNAFSEDEITKSGFYIEGWYKTKTGEGENAEYTDKWDFATDTIDRTGVTLYAKWVLSIQHTYSVCYKDEGGAPVVLGTYPVDAGDLFSDYGGYADDRYGFTPIGFVDEAGNAWNESFVHPGGEESVDVKVFVNYIEGNFKIVSTAKDLLRAVNSNIYLTADIDMAGEPISFADYKGILKGNGHKITNFKVSYSASKNDLIENNLYISLFGFAKGATVSDVSFENVVIDVNTGLTATQHIYVVPIGIKAEGVTFTNVNFSGTYTVTKLPKDRVESEMLTVVTDKAFSQQDAESVLTNVTVTLTRAGE